MINNKKVILIAILLVLLTFNYIFADVERRAAIDVGSGSTKIAIADVDVDSNLIINIILEQSFPVPYQASLDRSPSGCFDEETKRLGLQVFKEIRDLTDQYQVQKIVAIATSAFRKANNAKPFIVDIVKNANIKLQVIPQHEEGEIAFYSALAMNYFNPDDAVVWDIGTGSLQMITMDANKELITYMGEQMGSVAFKNYVIEIIQKRDLDEVNTPNPMTQEEINNADCYARTFGRRAYPGIKEKIKADNSVIIGIGRLFYHSLRPIASEGDVITRSGLRYYIAEALGKTDEEINNPYANVDVTNCILTLAMMKSLNIKEIHPVDSTSSRGVLISPAYWEN